jgi:predicted NAD/FAD-binding protein
MRIAIIGSGVSGLTAAHLLHRCHDITVFEARDRVGGHVRTIDVTGADGRPHAIDIGFIVFNEVNYPLFSRLLDELGVESQPSDMSFGVRSDRSGLEYSSSTVRSMFAQPVNLIRPSFHSMIHGILRFHREAGPAIRNGAGSLSLGEYLDRAGYSPRLAEDFLKPMGSALWSIPQGEVMEMPAEFFVRFFENHGMLTVNDQPEWRVIRGGSSRYVEALIAPFIDRIRLATPVRRVQRTPTGVLVDGEAFDQVVFACHSDQALATLADATREESEVLGALPFQRNDIVLHTDTSVLPRARKAWAAWNYRIAAEDEAPATVTYNMNRLQTLEAAATYCVTLNDTASIDPAAILHSTTFWHPRFTRDGVRAQERREDISGVNRTHYCGAWWGFGFHEDGVRSAYRVAEQLGVSR